MRLLRNQLTKSPAKCAASLALALCLGGGAARADLLAFYPLNGNADDASGNGLNGALNGSYSFASNAPFGGSAVQFDGVNNGFVTTPVSLDPGVNPDITFGAWVNASSQTVDSGAIRGVISGDQGYFGRTIDVDTRGGGLQWSIFTGTGVVSNGAVAADQWTFVAVRYDQAARTFAFNVNGDQVTGTTNFSAAAATATIGRNPNFDQPFGGEVADAFFFNNVLTDSQINAIRANGPSAILDLPLAAPEPSSALLLAFGSILLLAGATRKLLLGRSSL